MLLNSYELFVILCYISFKLSKIFEEGTSQKKKIFIYNNYLLF